MDLVYVPEVLSFGSFRTNLYRDYEQPWNLNEDYGKPKVYQHHKQQLQRKAKESSKEGCHLCKENKRRALAKYIKGRSRNNSCSEICEEEEENYCKKEEDPPRDAEKAK